MDQFKYRLLKIVNVTGLAFLEPVIRLCFWEEPRVQVKKIGQFIVVPIVAFMVFLFAWSTLAPRHKTKSGEVPTPGVVADAAEGVWSFHVRESDKEKAFTLTGNAVVLEKKRTKARLEQLTELEKKANEAVTTAEANKAENIKQLVAPVMKEYEARQSQIEKIQEERVAKLKAKAKSVKTSDEKSREAYIAEVRKHNALSQEEDEYLSGIKKQIDEIRAEKSPELIAALNNQTKIAEERQYLSKKLELLAQNRETKLAGQEKRIDALEAKFAKSKQSSERYAIATQIVKTEERAEKIAESEYAKPYTLPMQIVRSLFCVFTGFMLATMIAIPIGILCGLSPVFMAAMTPFIALFKPVSPIVWLPIALIIIGGFIPDPDDHWMIKTLEDAWLIGWMKINPAFMASAITVALCSLWPTLTNTALGVASIDKDHINVARVLRLGFFQRLFKIVIPSALPLIFAGLRISLGVGWMVLIAAELLSSSEGLGKFVWDMFNNGSSQTFAQMFVVVFVVGVIGLLLDRIMIVFQRSVSFDGAPATI